MVVTTPFFMQTLVNLGPLTTTFTAAPSCSTQATGLYIGMPFPELNETIPIAKSPGDCGKFIGVGDCVPDGAKIDAVWKDKDPLKYETIGWQINFHSPGVVCPSGWTTQAAITKQSDGKVVNPTGLFTPFPQFNATSPLTGRYRQVPPATALVSALEPGETAAICCPPGEWYMPGGFGCYSILPKDKFPVATEGCVTVPDDNFNGIYGTVTTSIVVDGVTQSAAELMSPTFTGMGTISTTTFKPSDVADYQMLTLVPGVIMVHKAEDTALVKNSSGTNAAFAMRPGGPDPKSLGGLALVVTTALMAGIAVMIPW